MVQDTPTQGRHSCCPSAQHSSFPSLPSHSHSPLLQLGACFYCTCIRPLLEYCAPVFHHAIPKYLSDDLERIQKRALHIITPGNSYRENLACHGLRSLQSRRDALCHKLFESMSHDQRMCSLFLPKHSAKYNLRHTRQFSLPRFRTERFKRSFIPTMCGIPFHNFLSFYSYCI